MIASVNSSVEMALPHCLFNFSDLACVCVFLMGICKKREIFLYCLLACISLYDCGRDVGCDISLSICFPNCFLFFVKFTVENK